MSVEPEDDVPEGGGCAGVTVLTVAALGLGTAIYAISSDTFVIAVWVVGWALVVKAARKPVQSTPDHSPSGSPEVVVTEEPQATGVEVTRVGESCIIVSHPDERRRYGVEGSRAPDS